jgi:hypothetical protein
LIQGVNTPTFQVIHGAGNADNTGDPVGLRVEVAATADVAAPEPGTSGIFTLGSGLAFVMLRRTRKNFNNRG